MGFFHRMANAHRRRNCLRKISINGRRLDKEAEIKEGLIDAFKTSCQALEFGVPLFPSSLLMKLSRGMLQSERSFLRGGDLDRNFKAQWGQSSWARWFPPCFLVL